MPTIRDDSLIPLSGRLPIPPRLSRGNHPASAFYAEITEWSIPFQQYVRAAIVTPADLELLLFLQDYPITVEVDSTYATFTTPFTANYKDFTEGPFYLDADRSGLSVILPQLSTAGLREQTRGQTAAGIEVSGYLCRGPIVDRNIFTGAAKDRALELHVEARSCAPVRHGPMIFTRSLAPPDTIVFRPILLKSADYTQQMRNDGDQFNEVVAGVTTIYSVVGLWALHV